MRRLVIGPRLPRSWFRDLDHEALDETEHVDAWHYLDIFPSSAVSSVNPHEFCQPCIAGVIMGDLNVEAAHRRQVIAAGMLSRFCQVPRSARPHGRSRAHLSHPLLFGKCCRSRCMYASRERFLSRSRNAPVRVEKRALHG